jgi:hypothetical protein
MASVVSDEEGQFSIRLPRWKFRQLAYLEVSATPSSQTSSTMVCDAYCGCGLRDGVIIHYGDSFPLSPGVLMRNVAMLRSGKKSLYRKLFSNTARGGGACRGHNEELNLAQY